MKRTILFAFVTLAFAACKNTDPELKLTLDPVVITCPDLGGDYTVSLNAPAAWSAQTDASWIKVTPTSGEAGTTEVQIKITANKESAESKNKVIFTSGEEKIELNITRAAKARASLKLTSEKYIKTPKEGGTYTVMVESNIKWSIAANVSWVKVSKGVSQNNDNIILTIDPATIPEITQAIITVSPYGEGKEASEQYIMIDRSGTDATSLKVSPIDNIFSAEGGTVTINVESNAKWIVIPDWYCDWVTIDKTSGENNESFNITVAPATNSDGAVCLINVVENTSYDKPASVQVRIQRNGKPTATLSVSPTKIDAPAEGGDYPVTIKSNYPWTASLIGVRIFSVSTQSGSGDATMIVTVKPSTEEKESTGSITISSSYGDEKAKINIRRAPKVASTLELSPSNINASYNGGEYTIKVKSNTSWKVYSSNTKVATISPESGSGDGVITVTIITATDSEKETARIVVTTDDGTVSKNVPVGREGLPQSQYVMKPFSISSKNKVYFSPGNLQYKASTDTWRFAEHQFNWVGDAELGNVYEKGVKSDNNKISSTYDGWIDLFGWGTGVNPTLHTEDFHDYNIFTDWGINTIYYQGSVYKPNSWRTMTKADWSYLVFSRDNCKELAGIATVNGREGFVLLPDDWKFSSALSFKGWSSNWDINVYSIETWQKMETAGAVFLPCVGWRYGIETGHWENCPSASYWSSTPDSNSYGDVAGWPFEFDCSQISTAESRLRYSGYAVRLVQDIK